MAFLKQFFCWLVLVPIHVFSIGEGYYWRDYTGTIPDDAIVGRNGTHGTSVYIGQAYLNNIGLIVVEIYPGVTEVKIPIWGIQKVKDDVKILCGSQSNFEWILSTALDLHLQLIERNAVLGGHYDGSSNPKDVQVPNFMHIGRVKNNDNQLRIGRITWFVGGVGPSLFYDNNGKEIAYQRYYQVLVYNSDKMDAVPKEYYWREYTGHIPVDAVIAGKDINGNALFIGQRYTRGKGLLVVPIVFEKRLRKRDGFTKILCGNQYHFYWVPANNENFHQVMIDKIPVRGGYKVMSGYLNIGRIYCDGEIKLGNVHSGTHNITFSFDDEGTERVFNSFEALAYRVVEFDTRSNVDIE